LISLTCRDSCYSDDSLKLLSQRSPSLQMLELNQTEITDYGLHCLSGMRELRVLVVNMCEKVSDIGMTSILDGCKKLESVRIGHLENRPGVQEFIFRKQLTKLVFFKSSETPAPWNNLFGMRWNPEHFD